MLICTAEGKRPRREREAPCLQTRRLRNRPRNTLRPGRGQWRRLVALPVPPAGAVAQAELLADIAHVVEQFVEIRRSTLRRLLERFEFDDPDDRVLLAKRCGESLPCGIRELGLELVLLYQDHLAPRTVFAGLALYVQAVSFRVDEKREFSWVCELAAFGTAGKP